MEKLLRASLCAVAIAGLASMGTAATKVWIPTVGGSWGGNGNWSPIGSPVAGDSVVINSDQSGNITNVPAISLVALTINGTCDFEAASAGNTVTVTGTFGVASGKTFTMGSTAGGRMSFTLSGSGTIAGTVSINQTSGVTQTFTNSSILSIPGTGLVTGSGAFTLGSSATLLIGSPEGITTSGATGSIQVAGTRTYSTTASYEYNGIAAQVTGNGLPATVGNLTVNNAAGVTLSASTNATGTLTLTSGLLTLGSFNLTAAAVSGGSATSYVATTGAGGLIRNVGATDVPFPVGPSASYNPVTINNAGTADNFTVSVQTAFTNAPPDANACVNRQWTITEAVAGGSDATITLQWNTGDQSGGFNPANPVAIGRYTGAQWTEVPATGAGSGPYTASATGFASFSPFAVGNVAALPIQLASFSVAASSSNGVTLTWTTLSEINCYGFNVQKSPDGNTGWVSLGFVPGNGTTVAPHTYSFADNVAPFTFYRLEQIDLDGSRYYSDPISLQATDVAERVNAPTVFSLEQNYPNPFNPSTTISYALPMSSLVRLTVYDMLGREVAVLVNERREAGVYDVKFQGAGLASGVYLYRLQAGDPSTSSGQVFSQAKRLLLLK